MTLVKKILDIICYLMTIIIMMVVSSHFIFGNPISAAIGHGLGAVIGVMIGRGLIQIVKWIWTGCRK